MSFTRQIISRASTDRLELLIEERLQPGSDKDRIDRRIWNLFGEQWAVLYTDLSGFSRRVAEFGVIHFLQTIYESHRLLVPVIQYGNGILLKTEGDSLMVIYRKPDDAVRSAIAMQQRCQRHSAEHKAEDQVLLCIGIGFGEVLRIGDDDIFGAEVNAACKLGEDTAKAHEILITGAVAQAIALPDGCRVEPLAEAPPGADQAFRLVYR
ncbi:MAG: adenylate cyclase [Betaproteobacteria bacterium RIFCSPLOWO2_02_67_12]|nr:MAG: adenylate cyclase [Betaproteobacteria bacterium RIFCSPLOWO2_02_67_12]OGA67663.1 MAG: adenylate cyclase [Betaproteobacteria bacterium RIFCSPLOWO2_12_FULL_67_28]